MPDDDDRPRDASSAADPAWHKPADESTDWAQASAPDDISALSRDIRAYHRELRSRRRQQKYGRFLGRPTSEPLTLLGVALVLAAIVAAAITLVQPRPAPKSSGALPLASVTQEAVPGGLLPNATLSAGTTSIAARALRPAVLALIPLQCHCSDLIKSLTSDAGAYNLDLDVIAPTRDAEAAALAGSLPDGEPLVYYDAADVLRSRFPATGLTLVVVDRDGTIAQVLPSVTSEREANLSAVLDQMTAPKTAAS